VADVNWPQIVSLAFGGLGGYFLKFYLDRKKEAEERKFEDKREHYRNLILCLKSLREGKTQHLEMLWFEYSFLWLYASDAVINSANNLMREIHREMKSFKDIIPLIGDLLIEMRRDIGFSRTSLSSQDYEGKQNNIK